MNEYLARQPSSRRTLVAVTAAVVVPLAAFGMAGRETPAVVESMHVARSGHQATLLPDGRVLVTGGSDDRGKAIDAAEIFNPTTRAWSAAAPSLVPRAGHAAVLIADGRVLVVGGLASVSSCEPLQSAEVYDPSTDRWSMTAAVPVPVGRGAAAVSLKDGRVLIAGGGTPCGDAYSSAALFDPSTSTWSRTASMEAPAQFHIGMLLDDGRVLVSGATTATYEPDTAAWASVGDPRPLTDAPCEGDVQRYSSALRPDSLIARATPENCSTLTMLPAGTLLMAGGISTATGAEQDSVRVSDLRTGEGEWSWPMRVARAGHTATRLKNGLVLIAGGRSGAARLASAEVYVPRLPYHAWTSAMTRGWINGAESFTYGAYAAAATNSHDNLLISYTGGTRHVAHLLEWVPLWADFTKGAWLEAGHRGTPTKTQEELRRGTADGRALVRGLPDFNSIRVDEHDNIWAVSSASQEVFKIGPQGQVLLRFGKPAPDSSGAPEASPTRRRRGQIGNPTDLAVDRRGNVFVTDASERPRIVKFDSRGRFIAAAGRKGSKPGALDLPHSIATDASGNVYVADSGNDRIQVFDNSLNLRAVYHDIGTPWAICITNGPRQVLYSASNPDRMETHRTAEIYQLELDGTILGKTVADDAGKVIITLKHIDCSRANTIVGVGYINLLRITFAH